jgi:putative FmdB family regulatory protein
MPLYDFHCPSCEHDFEEMAPSGGPAPKCPECGADTEKQISAPMLHSGNFKEMSRKGRLQAEKHKRNPPKPFVPRK